MKIRLIIEWIILIFFIILIVEAIFFTPLEVWAWGLTNDKLDSVVILGLTIITIRNMFDIYKLKQKENK